MSAATIVLLAALGLTGAVRPAATMLLDTAPAPPIRVGRLEVTVEAASSGPAGVKTFDLALEAVTASARERLKGRSAALRLSVRCEASMFRAENFRVYTGERRTGAEEVVALPDEWLRGEHGSDLPALRTALCEAPAAGDVAAKAASGPLSVQVGSFPSEGAARAALERWGAAVGRRGAAQIERGRVSGRDVFRLMVAVRDREAAKALCEKVRARAGDCLIRSCGGAESPAVKPPRGARPSAGSVAPR